MNKATELIRKQQSGKDNTPAFVIGLHLIDMMKQDGRIASILEEDLQNQDMSLEKCAQKLKEAADAKHRETKSSTICITPPEAEKIIRKFYGLPDPEEEPKERKPEEPATLPDIIELEDLI